MHLGNGINFKCTLITAEGYHESQEKQISKRPTATRNTLTLALRMGTDDSVRGPSVLEGGNAASVLLRKNWQLTARFLDWVMELLILTDLNSINRNVSIFSGRFNLLQSRGYRHRAKNVLMKSLCKQWILGIYSFESCAQHKKIL